MESYKVKVVKVGTIYKWSIIKNGCYTIKEGFANTRKEANEVADRNLTEILKNFDFS